MSGILLKFSSLQFINLNGRLLQRQGILEIGFDVKPELGKKIYEIPSKFRGKHCDYCDLLKLYRFVKILGTIANGIHDDAAIFLEYIADNPITNQLTDIFPDTRIVLDSYKPPSKISKTYANRFNDLLYHEYKLPIRAVDSLTEMVVKEFGTNYQILTFTIRTLISGDYKEFVRNKILPGYCSPTKTTIILSKLERTNIYVTMVLEEEFPDKIDKYLEFDDGEKEHLHKLLIVYELNRSMIVPHRDAACQMVSKNPLISMQNLQKKTDFIARKIIKIFDMEYDAFAIEFVYRICRF